MKNVWLKMKPTHGEVLRGMYLDKLKNTEALCDPKRAFNSLHGLRRAIFHLLEICPKSNQQFANNKVVLIILYQRKFVSQRSRNIKEQSSTRYSS